MSHRADDRDDAALFRYRVREVAQAQGVNLTQLARRADVTRETAERYWNNKVTRPTQALIKLERALECRVEDLIAIVNPDEQPPPPPEPPAPTSG
jgi:DNA-binding Xre family transcriptional regulator